MSQSGGVPRGGLSGTFPRGLLGVLRIRALVRDVNLLASSVGSSCQLLLESSSPSWLGLCKEVGGGGNTYPHDFHLKKVSLPPPRYLSPLSLLSGSGHPSPHPGETALLHFLPSFPPPRVQPSTLLGPLCPPTPQPASLPASGTQTQGDPLPSMSWAHNSQKRAR